MDLLDTLEESAETSKYKQDSPMNESQAIEPDEVFVDHTEVPVHRIKLESVERGILAKCSCGGYVWQIKGRVGVS